MGLYDETFGKIADALGGRPGAGSGPSNTQTTQVTDADRAAVQARRNSPEFKAAQARQQATQNAVSGVDTAMSKHADQVHPVK